MVKDDENSDAVGSRLYPLVMRLFAMRSMMAPHQTTSEQGKLICECGEILAGAMLAIAHLEENLMAGAKIVYQDEEWHLFAEDGNGIKSRRSLEDLVFDPPHRIKIFSERRQRASRPEVGDDGDALANPRPSVDSSHNAIGDSPPVGG